MPVHNMSDTISIIPFIRIKTLVFVTLLSFVAFISSILYLNSKAHSDSAAFNFTSMPFMPAVSADCPATRTPYEPAVSCIEVLPGAACIHTSCDTVTCAPNNMDGYAWQAVVTRNSEI